MFIKYSLKNLSTVIFYFLLTCIPHLVESTIQCYRCTINPPKMNETERLCSKFDYSKKYIVDCPESTFCMKQSYTIDLREEMITGILRDCAPQKNKYHALVDNKWEQKVRIEEPYKEGCFVEDDKGARIAPRNYCYCQGYLCNPAPSLKDNSYHVDAICVIFVYNALKLFYSLR